MSPLRRLEQYVVTRRPLVWRSRVSWFILGSVVLANVGLNVVGRVIPLSPARFPDPAALGVIVAALHGLGGAVLLLWAWGQVRSPLDELRPRRYVVLTLLYGACILSVLLNPLSLVFPLVHRTAGLVPEEEFLAEYSFHRGHGFWMCSAGFSEAEAVRYAGRIRAALERWGVAGRHTEVSVERFPACGPLAGTSARSDRIAADLQGRLEAVAAARAFRDAGTGPYARPVSRAPWYVALGLGLGLLLTLAVTQRHPWRRLRDPYGSLHPLPLRGLTLPGFMRRLDGYLVANRPVVWATRIHVLVFFSVLYGLVVAVTLRTLGGWGFVILVLGGALGLMGLWWWHQRHVDLRVDRTVSSHRALMLYLAAACSPALAGTLATLLTGEEITFSLSALLPVGMLAGSLVYIMKHLPERRFRATEPLMFWIAALIGFAGLFLGLEILVLSWVGLTVVMMLGARHLPRRLGALAAVLSLGLAPVILFVVWGLLAELFEPETWLVPTILAAGLFTYGVLAIPATRALLRYRYEPRKT